MAFKTLLCGEGAPKRVAKRSWLLIGIDVLSLLAVDFFLLIFSPSSVRRLSLRGTLFQIGIGLTAVMGLRCAGGIYHQIWRFANTAAYLRMMLLDFAAGWLCVLATRLVPNDMQITFMRTLAIVALNLLCSLALRFVYQFLYDNSVRSGQPTATALFKRLAGGNEPLMNVHPRKIRIAIVGAGRVGVLLAEELLNNPMAAYQPCCFIDTDKEKVGREILGIEVLHESDATLERLAAFPVQEIVFALPQMDGERKKALYDRYRETGCKLKVYDYPLTQVVDNGKRQLREFDIEELLFRQSVHLADEKTKAFYRDRVVLISGGGGSIGSELCRQIAKMSPRRLIVLDVYENGAYDIQQELRIAYGDRLDMRVEIASVQDKQQLERIFEQYRPEIVLHAAAHKHVPLMEHNCAEAVKNNVFGTLNMVNTAEKYGVVKFIMISTDKAVNPTNVMGATKRMCEMIVQSRTGSRTSFSATRFGNVLGSNGSVIPLFKRQIMNGGPITLTDKRIIRYFMTIPEASQLVLQSGAMAKNGELFVLDMGKPVKILELAENMIRLSGYVPYKDIDIVETGLRPGEKLYEELLIKSEELDKTENSMIFIERDKPKESWRIEEKLALLSEALATGDDSAVKAALKQAVSTFQDPDEVNATAVQAEEMRLAGSA